MLSTRFGVSRFSSRSLNITNINANVIKAEYAVRGAVVNKAMEYKAKLAAGEHLQFDHLIPLNIGNPLIFKQKPLTFHR
jgi:alanine transaminase